MIWSMTEWNSLYNKKPKKDWIIKALNQSLRALWVHAKHDEMAFSSCQEILSFMLTYLHYVISQWRDLVLRCSHWVFHHTRIVGLASGFNNPLIKFFFVCFNDNIFTGLLTHTCLTKIWPRLRHWTEHLGLFLSHCWGHSINEVMWVNTDY